LHQWHTLVPLEYRSAAYRNGPLPIGHDQAISQPFIVALKTELLQPKKTDRVLEVGTGSGYQAGEGHAGHFIKSRVAKGTTLNADEAASRNALSERFEVRRINHEEAYSFDGACTNWAEEFFSRMRRAEIGHDHHLAGAYLLRYAQEASWREHNRRVANGDQVNRLVALAMSRKPSVDFSGYWQRHKA
jgi:hypothetical protein